MANAKSSRKMPPVGAVGDVQLKYLWPRRARDRGYSHLNKSYNGCKCEFTITGKETRLVSKNKEAVCYIGTVPACKRWNSEEPNEMWVVANKFLCHNLTPAQLQMDPVLSEDIIDLDPQEEDNGAFARCILA
jgi:hypothetical protein